MPVQWTPLIPKGIFDFWEFDGDMSVSVSENVTWHVHNRELGLTGVSDGAYKEPTQVTVSGIISLTPVRFSRISPTGPFASATRMQNQWIQLTSLQEDLDTGILIVPGFGVYFNMVIGSIQGNRSSSAQQIDVTIQFQKIQIVSLQLTPAVVDGDAQALGAAGVADQGVVSG